MRHLLDSGKTLYVALSTEDPAVHGFVEPVACEYERTLLCGTGIALYSSYAVNFDTANGSWGTVTHYGIFDAEIGGNLLYYERFPCSHTICGGDSPRLIIARRRWYVPR